ncbi:zinc-binding dehydrogenase [Nocardia mexicana]|uniref:Threonine dehydrogenase-like Zn-dependent dehydrogenase n=1 Tax=Nocardia mexicana TaxID=279262 RepID=A0A370HBF4_9NOCA|nr:zinc-binding dehydrogenase [Nocardia mexicana]RDI54283.1 threonine dehydrogenase-like Zn-dependent dehydrogenase [Nocardia mexicana]
MRAVVMRDRRLVVDEVPDPVPGPGQVLVETIACGICGSDKQALDYTDEFLQASRDSGVPTFLFDPGRDLILGHELSARVIAAGPDTPHVPGQNVVALPWAVDTTGGIHGVGYSNEFPGGFGERMVLQAMALEPIPKHVPAHVAALTEPLAVGFGNVARTGIGPEGTGVVIGCGPVGLGAVAALAERGVAPIVASEPSKLRREAALRMGAHRVVDPAVEDPIEVWRELASPGQRLHVWVCAAVPGMINDLMYKVPRETRILQIGAVMTDDVIRPIVGLYKDIQLQMCMVYPHEEYARTLHRIAEGTFDAASLITAEVGLDGVAGAIDSLRHPDDHIQILVRPHL